MNKNLMLMLVLCSPLSFFGCAHQSGERNGDTTAITKTDDGRVVLIDVETKEPLPLIPCTPTSDPYPSGSTPCEIFRDLFRIRSVTNVNIIESERIDNTRCCKSVEIDGEWFETCKTVSARRCRRGWYRD